MNKLLRLIFCLLFYSSYAQIHIGAAGGTNTNGIFPCYDGNGYSYTQQIVLASEYQSEEGTAGPISQIRWKITSGAASASAFNNWTVYLGHTAKTSFSSPSDFIPIANLTNVFSGVVNITQDNQWITIDLPTSFNYNATDNLVVAVLQNTAGTSSNSFASYIPATSGNRGILAYGNAAVDVNNLSASAHHSQQVISQIQFTGTLKNCHKPKNLAVLNVVNGYATCSWTNDPNAVEGYVYELRNSGLPGSGTPGLVDSGNLAAGSTSKVCNNLPVNTELKFYLKALCSNNEESFWVEVKFTYVVGPAASTNQGFCLNSNAALSNIVVQGSNIKWYSAATGGNLLNSNTVLTNNTTYYASQTINGVESTERTPVLITLNIVPTAPVAPATQTYNNVNATLANLTVSASNPKWYISNAAYFPLSSNTVLSNGQTYYVSENNGGCESPRTAVTVQLSVNNYPCANWGTAPNQDYDCDGVINSSDLDDDNDGILDDDEREVSTAGNEFYIFAPPTIGYQNNFWYINISGQQGTIVIFNNNPYVIPSSGALTIPFAGNLTPALANNVVQTDKFKKLTANSPITVILEVKGNNAASDAYIVLPEKLWGKQYRLISKLQNTQYAMILSTSDNNQVVIKDKTGVQQKSFTLNDGQTYLQAISGVDMTGWTVSSTNKVAIVSGISCANSSSGACDNINEMLSPIELLGKTYFIPNGQPNTTYVMAEYPNTSVTVDNVQVANLVNPGDIYSLNVSNTDLKKIVTNKDVTVWQLTPNNYDPSWLKVFDYNKAVKDFNFTVPTSMTTSNVLVLIVPTADTGKIRLNNSPVGGWNSFPADPTMSLANVSSISQGQSVTVNSTTNQVPIISAYNGIGSSISTATSPSIGSYNLTTGNPVNLSDIDTDGDGIFDHFDLDSDNDGCSDANEAYNSKTAQGTDGNMIYGNGNPPAVDALGKVIGANYSGTNVNVRKQGNSSAITSQPQDAVSDISGTASFNVTVTGGSGTTLYQWQYSMDNGNTWNNIINGSVYSGATTATLNLNNITAAYHDYSYRVIINQSDFICGEVISDTVRLCLVTTAQTSVDANCSTIEIEGNVPTLGSGIWSIVSGSGGVISDPNSAETIFTGTPGNSYVLRWTITNGSCSSYSDLTIASVIAALKSVPTQVDVLCHGESTGSATAVISGGVAPYTYVWNNGITSTTNEASNLAVGTYEVTVTDANGCIIKQSFTITEPNALSSIPTQVDVLCHGNVTGSATAAISGGTAPYTYVWNNGITSTTNEATNLAAGTYEVTVTDANGCELTESFTITEPDVININLQETSFNTCSTCNESDLVATITGGTAPYTYLWNDGVTTKDRNDLLNGAYTLTITDANGCTASKNIVIGTKVELPYRDFTYTNGNAVSELNNFTTCQSGAVVKASSGSYTNGVWYVGSYELFVNNISLGLFTGEQTIDISNYIPITSVRAVGNHNFWSWTSIDVKTYSDIVDVPPTTPIVSNVYYELNSAATPLTATLNGVGTTLKWYSDELGSDYSANAPTPLTNQLGTTSYYVSQANSVGCESKRAKIYVIVVSPITYTHQIDDLLCFISTGSIDLSVSGGTGSYTYLWSNGATTEDITVSQGGNYTCTITDENSGFSITTQVFQVLQPLQLQATIASINVACFDGDNGEATATATDGTAPYTYLWNDINNQTTPTATGLVAGTYQVTVSDANGCIITETVTITEPTALQSTPTQVDVLCHGESTGLATVVISGGVAPYTYVWNNGITSTTNEASNLAAGTYEVTVTDANGCIIKQSFTITEPTALNSIPTQVNVLCHGNVTGSATAAISGGVAPYSYVWNNGITSTTNEASNLAAGTYEVTVTDANGCIIKQSFTITEPTALNSIPTQVNVLCHGESTGSATAAISGGVAPYSYVWNNGITSTSNEATNLAAGTYEVTVTDANGCIIKQSFTIIEPTALNSIPTQVDVLCHGNATGSATVVISGGVAPYTYVWNNGVASTTNEATNLAAGTYEVTVTDANGCIITETFTITEPTVLQSTPTQVNVLCHGNVTGSATVAISGGVAPYSYVWNNGITSTTNEATNLAAGTYEVTVTDANGCIIKQSFTITEPTALNSIPTQVDVLCHGASTGSATIVISGGVAPYTYVWNNGVASTTNEATNLAAGTYEVTVTDGNGCIITESFTITEPTVLQSVPSQVNVLCNNNATGSASTVISGGVAPYTYVWNNGVASTTNEATNLAAGTYEVTVTDANGCIITETFTITEPTVLQSTPTQVNVLCHGNVTGSATVTISGGVAPYTYVWNNGVASTTNEATNLAAGTYEVTVTDANGCIIKQSFTITEPTALNSIPTQVDVLCHGNATGSATAAISGGVAPYSYVWNSGIASTTSEATNLAAGTYEVTVTDANGCIIKQSFTITEPTALNSIPTQVDVLCHGNATGSATVVISGGVAPYTYVWNNGVVSTTNEATNLAAGTYEVTVTDANGCIITESFTITEPLAVTPPLVVDQNFCIAEKAKISNLVVTGTGVQWYDVAVGGSPLNTADLLDNGTYYATQTINGCESITRTAVQVTIYNTPQPTANDQQFCIDANATVEDLVAIGVNLKWYNSSTSTTPLATTALLATSTYFVSQTINGCESVIRTAVQVSVYNTIPPIAGNQEFCATLNAKVGNLIANGTAVKWYSTQKGGTSLNASDLLSTGIYYASQTLNGCESVTRTVVNVVVNDPIQLITTQLNVCNNTRIQNIIIEGLNYNQLKWYNSATGNTQLVSSQLLASGTYYVSTFVGGCESARQPIQVTVAAVVPTPTASFQIVCTGTQLNDLTVTKDPSAVLKWYTSLQSMLPVSENTIVSTGTYYVVQVIGECESARVAVQVQAVNVSTPTVFNLTMCEGTTIGDFNTGTTNYVWYVDNTTTTPLPNSFIITSGNYYIANKVSNCISERKLIATNVSTRPQSPTGQAKQTFNYSARIANLRMNEPNLKWFATYNDALMQVNELATNHYLKDATTYYAIAVGQNNCGSFIPTAVEVNINLGSQDLDMEHLNFYPNPVETVLNIDYIQEIKEIEVYTITGQRVYSKEFNTNKVTVDMSRLSKGTYLVQIKTEMAQQFIKVLKK